LIVSKEKYNYLHEDESELRKAFRHKRRNTQEGFEKFAEALKEFLSSSDAKNLPLRLRLDSDDLYTPSLGERERLFKELEQELIEIHDGSPSRKWVVYKNNYEISYVWYCVISPRKSENERSSKYMISVTESQTPILEINVFSYGGLNLEAITTNIEDAIVQLNASAERELDKAIPRVVILAFNSSIDFGIIQLKEHIEWLLQSHPTLSAIAVLKMIPEDEIPETDDIFEWLNHQLKSKKIPAFIAFHNQLISEIHPLSRDVFDDGRSIQYPSIN
jgi:hypothetical protein